MTETELKAQIDVLRAQLKDDILALRQECDAKIAALWRDHHLQLERIALGEEVGALPEPDEHISARLQYEP